MSWGSERRERAAANEKAIIEMSLRERELSIKEHEFRLREREFELKAKDQALSRWTNPLFVAVLAATVAALANIWVSYKSAESTAQLEDTKWRQTREDEKFRRLGIDMSELSTLLSQTLAIHNAALHRYEKDMGAGVIAPPKKATLNIDEYAYWEDKEFVNATASIQSVLIKIGVEDRNLHDKLLPIVHDVQRMHIEVAKHLMVDVLSYPLIQKLKAFAKSKGKPFKEDGRPWRNRVWSCYESLGPRLSQAFEEARGTGTTQVQGATSNINCATERKK